MSDESSLDGWQSRFEEWVDFAKPMMGEGRAKEAFGKYPWFTTDGDPFTRLEKPASEIRFGLLTTGGYSIEGEQEPMRAYPTFGDEIPQIRRIPVAAILPVFESYSSLPHRNSLTYWERRTTAINRRGHQQPKSKTKYMEVLHG